MMLYIYTSYLTYFNITNIGIDKGIICTNTVVLIISYIYITVLKHYNYYIIILIIS